MRRQLAQPVTSLDQLLPVLPERNQLLAVLLCELHAVLCEFAAHGFGAVRAEWERYHGWQDKPVQLLLPDGSKMKGVARGVDDTGALRVETAQGMQNFNAGGISLRKGV
jgi:BirA family biotin operon repressor/biotin-[acetyl-CoA-carboxylase] ligase